MNIRNHLRATWIAVLAIFNFVAPQAEANASIVCRLAKPNIATRIASSAKNTFYDLTQPIRNDIHLVQIGLEDTRLDKYMLKPIRNAFNDCIPHATTRSLLKLKAYEYTLTAPGFLLAASGDFEALAALSMFANQQGVHGAAATTVLLAGAGSWYVYDFGLNHIKKIPTNLQLNACDNQECILERMHNCI